MKKLALCLFCIGLTALPINAQTGGAERPRRSAPVIKNDQSPAKPEPKLPAAKSETASSSKTGAVSPGEDEVITVDTNLVTTPVSVLDRNGRFVPGLRKRDFKIFENGVAQKITYFQSAEQPFTVILMIDASPSTRYKIDEIHYAALTFVNQLRPNDKVMVVAFDQRVRILTEEPTSEKQKLYAAIYRAQFGSGTGLYDAIDAVVNLDLLKIPGRKAVVLFTDGVDTTSRRANFQSTIAEVEETDALIYPIRYDTQQKADNGKPQPPAGADISALLAQIPGVRVPPSAVIRVGRGQSPAEYEKGRLYLDALATNSGGRMFEADTITNLEASFAGVAEELRRQYTIGYYPDDTGSPGERRKIKIEVARPKTVVRSKTSYVIGQNERNKEPGI
jgi:VWFA-related protein